MSQSDLVQALAAVVRSTNRNASPVAVARAIVTGLSAAGYEIVRTRPSPGAKAPADGEPETDCGAADPVRRAG
ncbi:MAG TPA: hypothetical protein VIL48_18110 [Acidimicrobiales bacterium]